MREVERRIQRAEAGAKDAPVRDLDRPMGVPSTYADHARLMFDLQVLAFQADVTRVITFQLARETSNRTYPEIGVSDPHHPLTHHQGNQAMLDKVRQINSLHLDLFARFLEKLKATREGDSNLLDQSMIVYGSGISDGNVHTHDQLPTVLAGRGGNFLNPGRHIIYQRETPVANLFGSMLERLDVRPEHIGDSTGRLAGLSLS